MSSSSSSGSGTASPATPVAPPPATSVVFWDPDNAAAYQQFRKPGPWLTGKLAGQEVPGFMKVKVSGAKRKVDAASPPAKGGAKLTVKGWTPSSVTITITLWTLAHWEAWQRIKPLLRIDTNAKDSIAILHPIAEESSIYNILIESISGVEDGSIPGSKEITITGTDSGKPKDTGSGTAGNGKGGGLDGMTKDQWFVLYVAYLTPIRMSYGMWLPWSAWITNNGHSEFKSPPPAGYASVAPLGSPT